MINCIGCKYSMLEYDFSYIYYMNEIGFEVRTRIIMLILSTWEQAPYLLMACHLCIICISQNVK